VYHRHDVVIPSSGWHETCRSILDCRLQPSHQSVGYAVDKWVAV